MTHFYNKQADLVKGTIRDALKMDLYPSVTTILRCLNKPGINDYIVQQAIMGALTMPRTGEESDIQLMRRIIADGKQAAEDAARVGTDFHALINQYIMTGIVNIEMIDPQYLKCLEALYNFFMENKLVGQSEIQFANHRLGYGGCVDFAGILNDELVVIDFKTQAVKKALKSGLPAFKTYPEHAYQLAAYRNALVEQCPEYEKAKCINIMISTNPEIPGIKVKTWPTRHAKNMNVYDAQKVFASALKIYRAQHHFPENQLSEVPTTVKLLIESFEIPKAS